MNKPTPMLEQYLEIKDRHQDYILFYQLGDFFEMFFEDALMASRVLEITLTSRHKGDRGSGPHVRGSDPGRFRLYRPPGRKGVQGGALRASGRPGSRPRELFAGK